MNKGENRRLLTTSIENEHAMNPGNDLRVCAVRRNPMNIVEQKRGTKRKSLETVSGCLKGLLKCSFVCCDWLTHIKLISLAV